MTALILCFCAMIIGVLAAAIMVFEEIMDAIDRRRRCTTDKR